MPAEHAALFLAKSLALPALIVLLLLAEWRWPWRPHAAARAVGNWGLAALNAALLWLVPATALVLPAAWAEAHGIGLFNALAWPPWLEGTLAFLLLDCAVYLQHRLLHAVPLLWRLHRVHHSDVALDVSTGLRFHPLEAVLSAAWKIALVIALGAPVLVTGLFAIALSAGSVFSHANLRIPPALQRLLEKVLVTPAMHRIHHSVIAVEAQHNFGFFLPWWDHLLGTHRAQAAQGEALQLGQASDREPAQQRLGALLLQPFRPMNPLP